MLIKNHKLLTISSLWFLFNGESQIFKTRDDQCLCDSAALRENKNKFTQSREDAKGTTLDQI